LIPGEQDNGACLTTNAFNSRQPIRGDNPLWSDWIAYDAPGDSGLVVTFPIQEVGSKLLFAVQARDRAGAVSPTFEWDRNVRHVEITSGKFPLLSVTEQFLGVKRFSSINNLSSFDIVEGQPLSFAWSADATDYAGIIDAYRYGFDVSDFDDPDDPGWSVNWGNGPAWRRSQPRAFFQGAHNLVIQCRDNSGTITRGVYLFQVVQVPDLADQRKLLLVDDFQKLGADGIFLDRIWDGLWDEILRGEVAGFQNSDIIDATDEPSRLEFRTVADYRGVIWFTGPASDTFFHAQLAPKSNTFPVYNWLEIYQSRVGNLLFVGAGAMSNAVEPNPDGWIFPMIYNNSAPYPQLGFGVRTDVEGNIVNRGTDRYPYTSWCLEAVDIARPPSRFTYDESIRTGVRSRTLKCDALWSATVDTTSGASGFDASFPNAVSAFGVRDLVPTQARRDLNPPTYRFPNEEIYNVNVARSRPVALNIRDCQTVMFRWHARRDEVEQIEPCTPLAGPSVFENAPIGIASHAYMDTIGNFRAEIRL
jgi:hypothetical protein